MMLFGKGHRQVMQGESNAKHFDTVAGCGWRLINLGLAFIRYVCTKKMPFRQDCTAMFAFGRL